MGAGWNDSGCRVCTEWWSDSTGPHECDKRFCDGKMMLSDHSLVLLCFGVFPRGFLIPPSRACSCRCMLVASSVSPSSASSPLPSEVLKRSFCLPSAAVALLPCACRSSFARVCRPSSAQRVSSCIPVLDWRHHLCLSILFWDGRCQI